MLSIMLIIYLNVISSHSAVKVAVLYQYCTSSYREETDLEMAGNFLRSHHPSVVGGAVRHVSAFLIPVPYPEPYPPLAWGQAGSDNAEYVGECADSFISITMSIIPTNCIWEKIMSVQCRVIRDNYY